MSKERTKKINTAARRRGRLDSHLMPVLIWLISVACLVMMFQHRSERFEIIGIAQGRMHQISSPVDGRLKVLSVGLFDEVSKGQVLAILDQSQLDAQISTIQAEIEHLASQLPAAEDTMAAEAANLETDVLISQRRLYADVETARLRILDQKILLESDQATLAELDIDVKAARKLLETDAIAPYELEKAEALYNALAKKIQGSQSLLAQAEQDLETARKECAALAKRQAIHPSVENALLPLRKGIAVQEKRVAELTVQREAMKLICPADGKVVQIPLDSRQTVFRQGEDVLRRPGEVVLAGDPILVIAEAEPVEIVAYIGQELAIKVAEQMPVQLIKDTEPRKIAHSQIVAVGPVLELMPLQLRQNPDVAQWGRPVLIKIPSGLKLIGGETIGIKGL